MRRTITRRLLDRMPVQVVATDHLHDLYDTAADADLAHGYVEELREDLVAAHAAILLLADDRTYAGGYAAALNEIVKRARTRMDLNGINPHSVIRELADAMLTAEARRQLRLDNNRLGAA